MKIKKITLSGYTRVALTEAKRITLTFSEAIQLVIGTNGSGKSSLVYELSPLPGDPDDFEDGGFKIIELEYNGKEYTCINNYGKGGKHSFRIDGTDEELNQGGGIKMQRDLCKQHFGITQRIHDMQHGSVGSIFTAMGPEQRRYWFTELAETNYDYALGLYSKIKDKNRDVVGARKLAQKRLVVETAKIMSEAERIILEEDTESLYNTLRMVSELRQPVEGEAVTLELAYQGSLSRIEQLATQVVRLRNKVQASGVVSDQAITDGINDAKQTYAVLSQLSGKLYEEHEQIDKTLRNVAQAGEQNVQELEASLAEVTKKQNALRANRNIVKTAVPDAAELLRIFDNIRQPIETILMELPENTDRRFTPSLQEELSSRINDIRDQIAAHERGIIQMEANKSHLESHQKADLTECPNCHHQWKLGFNELVYKDLCAKLEASKASSRALQDALPSLVEKLTEMNAYLTQYRGIFSYIQGWPQLKVLWDHLIERKYILENPKKAMIDMGLFQIDMTSEIECNQMELEKEGFYRQLRLKQEIGNQDATRLKERALVIDEQIHDHAVKMAEAQKEVRRLEGLLGDYRTMVRTYEELSALGTKTTQANEQVVEHNRRTSILNVIRDLQSQLARKEDLLNSVRLQVGIIEDLKAQITAMEIDEQALQAILKELSPSDGLIAEGLLGFIKVFVAQMNAFIEQIWTYQLTIVPCQPDDDGEVDLNYRFPILVKTDDIKRSDVSKGSKGMKEIIDMAFIVTSMKYLGFAQAPLFLDEFASAMDTSHRFQAIQAVKDLVERQAFTQLFIISHNLEFHGAFPNAQMCVLDAENILVPAGMEMNKHVEFVM